MDGDLRLAFTSGWPLYAQPECLARDSLHTYMHMSDTDLFLFQSRVYPRLAESEPFKILDHWPLADAAVRLVLWQQKQTHK